MTKTKDSLPKDLITDLVVLSSMYKHLMIQRFEELEYDQDRAIKIGEELFFNNDNKNN